VIRQHRYDIDGEHQWWLDGCSDPDHLNALDWAIVSLENVRAVYPPGAEYWAEDRRQKLAALRSLRADLGGPR